MTGSPSTIDRMSHIATEIHISAHRRHQESAVEATASPVTRLAPNPPQHHTHLQQVAGCLQVDMGGGPGC